MERSATPKANPAVEKLRSDHSKLEHLTNSLLVGLEDLGRENARLERKLVKNQNKILLMANELDVYRVASTEAQGKLGGALRAKNELLAELQGFKNFNAQLGRQHDEARGSVIKLSIQLEDAQQEIKRLNFQVLEGRNELNGLKTQVEELYHVPTAAILDYSKLWPIFARSPMNEDAPPTPPEEPRTLKGSHAIRIHSNDSENNRTTLVSTPGNGTILSNPPVVDQIKATAGPSTDHQDAAILKPKANGITRGGRRVDESFARIKNNLTVTNKSNGSDPIRASYAPHDPRVSPSLHEFSWPQATLVQDVRRTLNPECVPFVQPAAKSKPISKLNPFSQEFVPAMKQPGKPLIPPHKRVVKVQSKSDDLEPANIPTETVTVLNTTPPPPSSEPKRTTPPGPNPVYATASAGIKPETAAVDSFSKPHGSSTDPSETEDASSKIKDDVAIVKDVKALPPHLRGLPRKAASAKLLPAANLTTSSTPLDADASLKDPNTTHPEAETMKAWLDTLEKQAMGQSLPGERSDSTPSSLPCERLIDLNIEDAGKPSNGVSAPGFTLEAMQELLDKTKAASPTPTSESQTLESLLATCQTLLAKEPKGSNLTAILQGLLAQYQTTQMVPANLQVSQGTLEDEAYNTATSGDPYLMHVSRETTATHITKIQKEQNKGGTSTSQIAVPKLQAANTTGGSEDGLAHSEEVDKHISNFKAQLPANKNESSIATDFLTAYNSKLVGVTSKYGKSAKSEKDSSSKGAPTREPTRYHRDQYLDPDYTAPKIVGTRKLGELLDTSTKSMIMNETPASRGQNMKIELEWKPVIEGGRTIFVL